MEGGGWGVGGGAHLSCDVVGWAVGQVQGREYFRLTVSSGCCSKIDHQCQHMGCSLIKRSLMSWSSPFRHRARLQV